MSDRLRDLIDDGRVHVIDGAMGTMLYSKGVFVNVCYDELNLTQPATVQEVHEAYVRAGAEIVETNTFGANPVKLSSFGLDGRTEDINRAAVEIARRAARDHACVVGAIGPLGIRIEPFGPTSRDEAVAYFKRQVTGLADAGVDGVILETFGDLEELLAAFLAARSVTDLPVIAQMTVGEDARTPYGTAVDTIATSLTQWQADVIGLNCSVGPAAMLDALEQMAELTDRPLSAQPNAGLPRAVGDRKIYLASPEYMGQYARRLIQSGTRFVGGCCGTTPDHIKKIRDYVASVQPRLTAVAVNRGRVSETTAAKAVPIADRSRWGKKIATGDLAVSVELIPPSGWDPSNMVEQARALKQAGIDAVSVLDSPRAQCRMGVVPAALIIEREVGIETIVHYTCRDRNMLGMISDLLGAAAAGLRNLLIITGDPPRMGPYPDSTGVFDIDSIGLTNVVYRLNHGLDPGGNTLGQPTRYVIGVAANQGAVDVPKELERFAWKVEAGADFAVTQPVFDPEQLRRFLDRAAEWPIPVVAGIWPLVSLRNAEFLANEVPGLTVPATVIDRMRKAQERGKDAAAAEGVRIAREMFDAVRDRVAGIHVSAPLGRVDLAIDLFQSVSPAQR